MIAADYQYETAVYALAVLMGYPEGTLPEHITFPEGYQTDFVDLPAVEIYLDAALANRPDLKAYREQLNIAQYQVYQAWGAYSPTVSGYAQWSISSKDEKNYPQYHWDSIDTTGFSYGIQASWTIFNGAIRFNQLREAQASQAVAEYQVAAQWFAVVSEVRTAYANYIQNVRKTRLLAEVRELSARQRDLVQEEYQAGKAELTRLNEAQRDLVEAETSLASSYINVQNAKAQLISVVGGTTAEYYLNNDGNGRYPGLDGVASAEESVASGSAGGQTEPVSAPTVNRPAPAGNAPAIPGTASEQ
jgi:outer membrane protein TolC